MGATHFKTKTLKQVRIEMSLQGAETARLVVFSDATTFSRAFKRWTGSSPRSVRVGIPTDLVSAGRGVANINRPVLGTRANAHWKARGRLL